MGSPTSLDPHREQVEKPLRDPGRRGVNLTEHARDVDAAM